MSTQRRPVCRGSISINVDKTGPAPDLSGSPTFGSPRYPFTGRHPKSQGSERMSAFDVDEEAGP